MGLLRPGRMATLSATATVRAGELRALLRAGALPRLGLVDVGLGSRLSFELTVRATLNDLARLAARADAGSAVGPYRRRLLCADLERLHRLAVTARSSVRP